MRVRPNEGTLDFRSFGPVATCAGAVVVYSALGIDNGPGLSLRFHEWSFCTLFVQPSPALEAHQESVQASIES